MKTFKNFLKSKNKCIWILIGGALFTIATVSAAIIVSSSNVSISSSKTSKTNLHDAIEELYGLASSGSCPYGQTCIRCGAGSYADQTNMVCTTCIAGTYSEGGTNSCLSCPSNYTSDAEAKGENECYIETTAGKFIEIANTSVQMDCPEGSYCPSEKVYYGNTGIINTCPTGYTSLSEATKETDCFIQTTAGKYIANANDSTETNCPVGSYCPSTKVNYGSAGGVVTCPSGYTSDANATKESDCYLVTTAGKYIATAKTTTQTTCTANYYCESTKIYYGNTGGRTECSGIYNHSNEGSTSRGNCYVTTTAGKYIKTANDSSETNCPVGSYCPSANVNYGTTGSINTCPSGYTSDANATKESDCYLVTTAGKYVATANSSTQTNCTSGSYCASTKVYYGNTGGITTCPSIYTNSPVGASVASQCYVTTTAGKYIASANDNSQTNCSSGNYCPSTNVNYGSTGSISECPSGYTSDANATSQGSCYIQTTAGKYIATAYTTTQTNCTSGSYCSSTKVYYGNTGGITSCPSGYGNSAASSTSASQCYLRTSSGKYVATSYGSQTSCTSGGYCPGSVTVYYGSTGGRTSCPSGYGSSASSSTSESSCYLSTTAGKYVSTAKSSQTNCTSGGYCPGSVTVYYGSTGGRTSCPSGYGNSAASSTLESSCYLSTTAGKYIATAYSSTQTTCPAGSYCPSATIYYGSTGNITSCGSGKTSPAGSSSSSACVSSTYTYTKTGSNGFTGTYTCNRNTGTATITGCSYSGTYGAAVCDGGSLGGSPTYMCTKYSYPNGVNLDYAGYLDNSCNSSLSNTLVWGGSIPSSESCS